jgi:hypothetical protein
MAILDDLRQDLRDRLNEATAAFWTDAVLTRYLTEAARDLSTKSGCVEAVAQLVLIPNVRQYVVPSTFLSPTLAGSNLVVTQIHAIFLETGIAVHQVVHKSMGHIHDDVTGNIPQNYAHFGPRLYLFPVGAGATGALELLCSVQTNAVDDIPAPWRPLLVLYAAHAAKQQEGSPQEAAGFYSEYINSLVFQRNALLQRPTTSRAEISVPDDVRPSNG